MNSTDIVLTLKSGAKVRLRRLDDPERSVFYIGLDNDSAQIQPDELRQVRANIDRILGES